MMEMMKFGSFRKIKMNQISCEVEGETRRLELFPDKY
jgi:hypothetical protein